MKLEQVVKRRVTVKEAESILKVLERMKQEKTAEYYRKMLKMNRDDTPEHGSTEEGRILSSRQKILEGAFSDDSREIADPICRYLFLSRDVVLHAGIMSEGRSVKGCLKYVFDKAQEQAVKHRRNHVAVMDTVVYGWVKEYFLDESFEEEKKKSRGIVFSESNKKQTLKKSGTKNAEGQMSLFDILGTQN